MIVLDTSALIYWTLNPSDLSLVATKTIQQASAITISSISIWEIGLKSTKNRLYLGGSLQDYVQGLREISNLTIQAVDDRTWLENVLLAWSHRDPADRTIVATALLLDCPLVTSDRAIRAFYPKAVW